MNPVSVFPVLAALCIAIVTAFLLAKKTNIPVVSGRYSSIDGLRGYLAFFVFLHHAAVWYFYLHTGQWRVPPSNLYTQFGQGSVALFFMITGFLFWSKLIDAKYYPIDWTRLFVSRLLRLTPLYLFVMFLMFNIVAYLSGYTIKGSVIWFFIAIAQWLSFTVLDNAILNGIHETNYIVAGVTWSLPYEWFFYCSLPVFAFILRVKVPVFYVLFSILVMVGFILWQPIVYHVCAFAGGIVSAYLVRSVKFCSFAKHWLSSIVVLILCAGNVIFFASPYSFVPLLLLFAAFAIIACGNNMFGILTHAASKVLGEMAYSIYLLHGITLFITFKFILGYQLAVRLTSLEYWLVVLCCVPILIICSFITFCNIEKPAMLLTSKWTNWLHERRNRYIQIAGAKHDKKI